MPKLEPEEHIPGVGQEMVEFLGCLFPFGSARFYGPQAPSIALSAVERGLVTIVKYDDWQMGDCHEVSLTKTGRILSKRKSIFISWLAFLLGQDDKRVDP